jgi:hypothetical protein
MDNKLWLCPGYLDTICKKIASTIDVVELIKDKSIDAPKMNYSKQE